MEKKMRLSHWLQGFGVSLLIFLLWSNIGPRVDIGRIKYQWPRKNSDDYEAFQELTSQIGKHPFANKFTIRWTKVNLKGEMNHELHYNRLARSIKLISHTNYYGPSITCHGARDWIINKVVSGGAYWVVVLNENGGSCDTDVRPIP